jgi:hypothetical protein
MIEEARGGAVRRPLDLPDATSRVQQHRRATVTGSRYVYFHNQAEPGVSLGRPLVEIRTPKDSYYLNSLGDAFIEDAAASQFTTSDPSLTVPFKALKHLGRW